MTTITVKNSAGGDEVVEKPLAPGRAAAAQSRPIVLANEDKAVLDTLATSARQDLTNTSLGALNDAEATGNGSINAILKRLRTLVGSLIAALPATLGQKTKDASLAVALASDQDAIPVIPQLSSGNNLTPIQTAVVGTNYTPFEAQACKQLTICNDSGADLQFRQTGGGAKTLTIFNKDKFSIFGISNANQIEVRRKDTSNTQVTVEARWEA